MIYLGLDPGTSDNMAIAALSDTFLAVRLAAGGKEKDAKERAAGAHARVRSAFMSLAIPSGLIQCTLAVEWQRPLSTDKKPQNICDLAAFAGIALATIQSLTHCLQVLAPLPQEWKGSIDKHIKHNRIVAAAGGAVRVSKALEAAEIPVPANLGAFEKLFTGKAGDALDAIGLALWARERAKLQALVRSATLPPSSR